MFSQYEMTYSLTDDVDVKISFNYYPKEDPSFTSTGRDDSVDDFKVWNGSRWCDISEYPQIQIDSLEQAAFDHVYSENKKYQAYLDDAFTRMRKDESL